MTCLRPQRTATRPGLELGTPWSVVRDANHCATKPNYVTPKHIFAVSEQYCAFVLQNHSGVITSPDLDLDGAYDFNLHCTWSITVDPKNQIQYQIPYLYIRASIKMVDSYILECYGDYLMVG